MADLHSCASLTMMRPAHHQCCSIIVKQHPCGAGRYTVSHRILGFILLMMYRNTQRTQHLDGTKRHQTSFHSGLFCCAAFKCLELGKMRVRKGTFQWELSVFGTLHEWQRGHNGVLSCEDNSESSETEDPEWVEQDTETLLPRRGAMSVVWRSNVDLTSIKRFSGNVAEQTWLHRLSSKHVLECED